MYYWSHLVRPTNLYTSISYDRSPSSLWIKVFKEIDLDMYHDKSNSHADRLCYVFSSLSSCSIIMFIVLTAIIPRD